MSSASSPRSSRAKSSQLHGARRPGGPGARRTSPLHPTSPSLPSLTALPAARSAAAGAIFPIEVRALSPLAVDTGTGPDFSFTALPPRQVAAAGSARTIIAISTSSDVEQVAWQGADGSRKVWRQRWRRGQPRRLLPAALAMAGAEALGQVQLVVCDVGPGSFTGLRLGLATARAIAWLAGAATRSVKSSALLGAAARAAGILGPLRVLLPSRAGYVYDAWLAPAGQDEPPGVETVERALTAVQAAWSGPFSPMETTLILSPEIEHLAAPLSAGFQVVVLVTAPDAACLLDSDLAARPAANWAAVVPHYVGISEAERAGGTTADHPGLPVQRG